MLQSHGFGELLLFSPSHHAPWQQTQMLWGCCKSCQAREAQGSSGGTPGRGSGRDTTLHTTERFQSHCGKPSPGTPLGKDEPSAAGAFFPPNSACGALGRAKRWALSPVAGKAAAAAGHGCPTLLCAKSSQAPLSAINSTNLGSTQSRRRRRRDGFKHPTITDRGHPCGLAGDRDPLHC